MIDSVMPNTFIDDVEVFNAGLQGQVLLNVEDFLRCLNTGSISSNLSYLAEKYKQLKPYYLEYDLDHERQFMVPDRKIGALMSSEASRMSKIRAFFPCKIYISAEEKHRGKRAKPRRVTLKGTKKQIQATEYVLRRAMEDAFYDFEKDPDVPEFDPDEAVPAVEKNSEAAMINY